MFDLSTIPEKAQVLVPLQELTSFFQKIVRTEVRTNYEEALQEKLLSPKSTCNLFDPAISLPTLASWTEKGYLKKYTMDGRTWYKYSEVIASLKEIKKYSRL